VTFFAPAPRETFRRAIVYTYWFVLSLCLLNYGANDPVTVALGAVFVFALLPPLILAFGLPQKTQAPFAVGVCLLAATIGWIFLQTTPLPGDWLSAPAWAELKQFTTDVRPVISLTPHDDLASYLKLALPVGVFLTSLLLFRSEQQAEVALKIYAIAGGVIAICAIFQFTFFPKKLMFIDKPAYLDSVTAFFINRNTAATFFGLICLLLFARLWAIARSLKLGDIFLAMEYRHKVPRGQRKLLIQLVAYGSLFLISVLALVLTKSRAGVTASVVSLLVFVVFLALAGSTSSQRRSDVPRRSLAFRVFVAMGLVCGISVLFAAVSGRVLLRAATRGLDDTRYCLMPGLLADARDHMPLGSGLASFQESFPAYRDASCGIVALVDKAHNFYLEGMITMGILFPVLLVSIVIYLVTVFVRCIKVRRSYRYIGGLGLSTLLLVLIHSAFDFSLQIPGFAIVFAAVLAPLVTIACGRTKAVGPVEPLGGTASLHGRA
jgi:hypothetical protein